MLIKQNVFNSLIIVFVGVEYLSECYGHQLLPLSYNNLTRFKRQSGCKKGQFACDNGQCISIYNYCDGKSDCSDESDEVINCNIDGCTINEFQCAYGACINKNAKCDGKQDCRDNSDENAKICANVVSPKSGECPAPVIENAKFEILGNPKYVLGDPIPNLTVLNFTCNSDNYTLSTLNNLVYCHETIYQPELPKCVPSCSGRFSTSIDVDCELNDVKINCLEKVPEGTIVSMKCKPHYVELNPSPSTTICLGGNWDVPQKQCMPVTCAPTFLTSVDVDCKLDGIREDCTKNVRVGTVAHMKCKPNFIDKNPEFSKAICTTNGEWDVPLKQCTSPHMCSPRVSTTLNIYCELNGVVQDCTKDVPYGTSSSMTCKPSYVDIDGGPTIAICTNGSWSLPLKECIPDCDQTVPEGQPLIINGTSTNRGDFPWHVAIYRQSSEGFQDFKCGGSIISVKAVISAAHCFTDPNNGNLYPVIEYSVAAGKKYSKWNAPEDAYFVQNRNVHKIYTPRNIYFGQVSSYAGDIAVVFVDKLFTFTNFIKAVCVDWNLKYVNQHLVDGTLGKVTVAGWGSTTTGNPIASVQLKQLTIPYVKRDNCIEIVPKTFLSFVTVDKFCAGYTNGSSVCNGDSGGGIVFPHRNYYGIKKYYLQGIISTGPTKDGSCDDHQLGVYTKVSSYIAFIKKTEQSNYSKVPGEECPTPTIENGKYEVLRNPQYILGDPIPNFTFLNFKCNSDYYMLTTTYNLVFCINGKFQKELPKCVSSCSAIFSTSIDVDCEFNGAKVNCSKKVPEGTVASMKCKPHYVELNQGPSKAFCFGGSWDIPTKRCTIECGEPVPKAQPLITNGETAIRTEFPWHVGIYKQKSGKPKTYLCGGSIISVKVVLSVAHCFTTSNGTLYPISEFYVAAGKYYSDWSAPKDDDFVQKRKVLKIEYPRNIYFGYEINFAGDISIVVVEEPFIVNNVVKPVCVNWSPEYKGQIIKSGAVGQIPGWGFTENEKLSVGLKYFTAPFIELRQCLQIVPQSFRTYLTLDKYCAGYTNGTSACTGDSGGGMVFPKQGLTGIRYYIEGVLSVGPSNGATCDGHQLGVYTKVESYIQLIEEIEAANRIN